MEGLTFSFDALPGMLGMMRHSGIDTLQKLLEVAGPVLSEVQMLSSDIFGCFIQSSLELL